MKKAKRNLFIGTSGWVYGHWQGVFYPESLRAKDKLKYYSKVFKTTEINYSFYHLPRPTTYQKWYSETPEDFLFAVKASRFITHIKRLKGVREAWKTFLANACYMREKLGPILFQFPSSFKATEENIKRLESFLKFITSHQLINSLTHKLRFAFEFRHKSWCDEKIYKLLKKYNAAWVIADSPHYPRVDVTTADFCYIRMHGSKVLFASKYTKKELQDLSEMIKKFLKEKKDVYCYFNNDALGFAVTNAKQLLKLLRKEDHS